MEYLKRIETLEKLNVWNRQVMAGLAILLGLFMVFVPQALKSASPVLIQTEHGVAVASVEPWKLSTSRIESFTKAYLSARFEWSEENFEERRKALETLTDPAVLSKLKDSTQAFEGLAKNQHAKSYYVFEGYGFSNAQEKIEAHITRVLRIQDSALATPLVIRLAYAETALSPENPYGLKVTAVDESEAGVSPGRNP